MIKYTAQSRPNFGLHTDGSAVTVNVALSDERKNGSVADDEFSGGGTYFPARGVRQLGMLRSQTPVSRSCTTGRRSTRAHESPRARYVLVGFFYGSEAPPSPGSRASSRLASTDGMAPGDARPDALPSRRRRRCRSASPTM